MFPAEVFRNTLGKIVGVFARHEVPFHLTGGLTSVLYGEPRLTQDVDIVIDNQAVTNALDAFVASLRNTGFIFDDHTLRDAIASRGMFQLFDQVEALKLDIYPRELIPGELSRSQVVEVFEGMHLPVVSRADAAVSKLVWTSKGSHKSRKDLRRIFDAAAEDDRKLIRALAQQLELGALLEEVLREPDELIQ